MIVRKCFRVVVTRLPHPTKLEQSVQPDMLVSATQGAFIPVSHQGDSKKCQQTHRHRQHILCLLSFSIMCLTMAAFLLADSAGVGEKLFHCIPKGHIPIGSHRCIGEKRCEVKCSAVK